MAGRRGRQGEEGARDARACCGGASAPPVGRLGSAASARPASLRRVGQGQDRLIGLPRHPLHLIGGALLAEQTARGLAPLGEVGDGDRHHPSDCCTGLSKTSGVTTMAGRESAVTTK